MQLRLRFSIKAIFFITTVTGLLISFLACIPTTAKILVPWQHGDAMENSLARQGARATRAKAGSFNCQYFSSIDGKAYKIWLAQNALLKDAKAGGYYCEITYTASLPIRTLRIGVGDDRMVGLQ